MGMGVSLILIAIGAILVWAVNTDAEGFNINAIGWILLVVGAVGALVSLLFWSSWASAGTRRRETVVREDRL